MKAKVEIICMSHQNENLRVNKIRHHAQLLRDKGAKMKQVIGCIYYKHVGRAKSKITFFKLIFSMGAEKVNDS